MSINMYLDRSFSLLSTGVGYLLFIAHARITATDCKCRFYGPCAVNSATLNGVPQPPLTEVCSSVPNPERQEQLRNSTCILASRGYFSKNYLGVVGCQFIFFLARGMSQNPELDRFKIFGG